jgi:hypothetical protein
MLLLVPEQANAKKQKNPKLGVRKVPHHQAIRTLRDGAGASSCGFPSSLAMEKI